MPGTHRRPLILLCALMMVAAGAVATSASSASAGHITSITVSPVVVFPAFDEDASDYALRCAAGSNNVDVTVVAPATTIEVNGVVVASGAATPVTVDEDELITVEVTDGGGTKEYFYRCLPADFPTYTIDKPGTPEPGYYLMAFGLCFNTCPTSGGNFVALVDTNGVPVWYKRLRAPILDQKLRSDGTLSYFEAGPGPRGHQINTLDGALVEFVRSIGYDTDNHEFYELANGNDIVTANVDRPTPGDPEPVVIDAYIQEIDGAGNLVWEWRSQDHIDAGENQSFRADDLIHINSVHEFPDGDLLMSGRSVGVYRIDRATGVIVWKLGGTTTPESLTIVGDDVYSPAVDGPRFQHDARVLDDGSIFIFDNRGPGEKARATNYVIDEGLNTATLVWQYQHTAPSAFMGGARRQPVGGVTGSAAGAAVIGWGGSSPMLEEVDFAGVRQFAIIGPGEQQYRVVKYPPGDIDVDTLRALAGGTMESDAPTGVTASAGSGEATVSWTAPTVGAPITGYTVTSQPGGLTCTTTGATSCVVENLTPGETYTFVVRADNTWGSSLGSLDSSPLTLSPDVSISTPADGAVYVRGSEVLADFSCSAVPGGPAVLSCSGSVPAGVAIDTATVGEKTFSVTGTDANNDVATVTHHYTVLPVFTPVSPFRLEDTRQVGGQRVGSADGTAPPLQFNVLGRGGLPASGVGAVSLNVTVDRGGLPNVGGGFVTVDGCESPRPTASNLNFGAGQTVPNAVLTPVSPTGDVCVYVYGTADILVDVNGYFPEVSDFTPVSPFRLEDTRQVGGQRVGSADGTAPPLQFNVLGRGGLPASGVGAVSLNVTVDRGGLPNVGGGFVTVDGCESPRPTASNLNFGAGQTVPNAVLTPVSPTGDVCVYVYGTADILVDVNGYFPEVSDFTPVSPFRLEDTRQVGGQRVGSADGTAPPLQFNVLGRGGLPASGVGAVSLNVTVDRGGLPNVGGGFVTVDGCESPRPTASNLNFGAGQTVPNAVLTPVSPTGDVCVYVYGTADILVDVNGYFPD